MAALNIRNDEAVKLVNKLAAREGKSMTTVVIEAIRERLERAHTSGNNEVRMKHILSLGRPVQEMADRQWLQEDQVHEPYDDELGLPT